MHVPRTLLLPTLAAITVSLTLGGLHAAELSQENEADEVLGDVTLLPAFDASARRMEDFGFRVSPAYDAARSFMINRVYTPVVDVVLPNTAASRAGVTPGHRIVSSDGEPTASRSFSIKKWRRIQESKWSAVAAGEKDVVWTLEVEEPRTKQRRVLTLRIPTPAPRWGAPSWQAPDRPAATVAEPGPLADRARTVLDHGIWILLRGSYVRGFNLPVDETRPHFLCYQWTLRSGATGHRMYVSQERGRTDIILEVISAESHADLSKTAATSGPVPTLTSATTVFARESRAYLTSPSGALEKAWALPRNAPQQEIPLESARAEFQREIDFWLNNVAPVTRWPLAVVAEEKPEIAGAPAPPAIEAASPASTLPAQERSRAFLELPPARASQRELFDEAFGKIGRDEDHWAYTEISRRLGEKRPTVVRVDPSKPQSERCTLLRIDGKTPGADDVRRWKDQGGDESDPLGALKNIRDVVDRTDVRVFADEHTSVVFELAIRGETQGFSGDKLQALFRVNKTTRALEDIIVKMRGSMRLSAGAKVTEAGLEVRFRTLDPAYPPQPVRLKGGGAVRVIVVKIARDFETTRTDYQRVEPYAPLP